MRNGALVLMAALALGVIAAAWFLVGDRASGEDLVTAVAPIASGAVGLEEEVATTRGDRPVPTTGLVAPAESPRGALPVVAAGTNGPRTLDGTIVDRFGHPVSRERVWLLAPEQGHPPADAAFGDYVTALTSTQGVFSLTLRDAGPYRLAVGARGEPRLPPTDARLLSGLPRASVVVPGAASVRVVFDDMPAAEGPLALELLTLRDSASVLDGGGFRRGEGRRGGERGGAGGPARPDERRGGRGGGSARTVAYVQDRRARRGEGATPPQGLQDQAGNRGERRGRDRDGEGEDDEVAPVPEPPRESWRSTVQHRLTEEERAGAPIELSGLPAGRVARLALRVGRQRIEGVGRFTLVPDSIVEVRVLSVATGADADLSYLTTTRGLGADAPPAGVRWE